MSKLRPSRSLKSWGAQESVRSRLVALACYLTLVFPMSSATADIPGFGFLLDADWQINFPDGGSQPLAISEGRVRLTTATREDQRRSIFFRTQQNVTRFAASFTYQETDINAGEYGGLCFVIHRNNPENCGGARNDLGYRNGGFGSSIAVTLNLAGNLSGVFRDGNLNDVGDPVAPVNFHSGNPIRVTISYDGQLLRVNMTDTVTNDTVDLPAPSINIPSVIGGNVGYVGFTTGTRYGIAQYLSAFTFESPETPCASPAEGDLDRDGDVDLQDLAVLLANFGRICL